VQLRSIVHPVESALIDGQASVVVELAPRDVAQTLGAVVRTSLLLRTRTLESIVRRTANRRQKVAQALPTCSAAELDRLRPRVAAFLRARPFFFGARDACVRDSLAMGEFLAAEGFYPNWVFGVSTDPFEAHCWLQIGEVVLNDTPDNVRTYTPIMAV
jgi:hypothetical protein